MQIGALTAFLQLPDADPDVGDDGDLHARHGARGPRSAPSGSSEVLDTESSVVAADEPGRPPVAAAARSSCASVDVPLPGRRGRRCCATSRFTARPGQTTAIIGSTGAGKTTLLVLVPRLFDATGGTVLVDGVDVRELDPTTCWSRIGLVPQKPYLFTGTVASNLRYGKPGRHRRGAVGRARDRPGRRLRRRRCPSGLDAPDRPGRHQRLRRPAAAARDRPGAGRAGRRSTCSTTRSRRSTWPPTPGCARRCGPVTARRDGASSSPSGCPRSSTPTRSWCSRTAAVVGAGTHDELLETCPTYAEIVESQLHARRRRHEPRQSRPPRRRPPRPDAARPAGGGPAGDDERRACRPRSRWTSARRPSGCSAGCGPNACTARRRARAARSSASTLSVDRPEDPRPRHRPHLRRRHRPAAARRASPRQQAIDAACGPQGDGRLADMLVRHGRRPRAGHRLRRARPACCCSSCALYVARVAAHAGCRATCSTASCSAPCYRLRAEVEDKLNRLPLSYFDSQPRGELLSRVTNDIDNIGQTLQQTLSQLLTSLLTVVGVLGDDVLDLAAAGAGRAGHGAAVDARHRADRASARSRCSSRSGAAPASSTRTSRRPSPATRWSRSSAARTRSRQAFAREERRAVRGQLRRAVRLRASSCRR